MNAGVPVMPWSRTAPHRALLCWLLLWLLPLAPALAAVQVNVAGPGGSAAMSLPDSGGAFDVSIPLQRNAVNPIRVTATDDAGNRAEQTLSVTQVSLESVVVSRIRSERLSVERVEQLVTDGLLDLEDPANYNVSVFDIVLTIANRPVPISVPIAMPKAEAPEGYEEIRMPPGRDDNGGPPTPQPVEIIVFDEGVATPSGEFVSIPGVLVIEGRIRSLKELYSVRLLLMNTSGIFTLSDVTASIAFPDGGLTAMIPADALIAFGEILPGSGEEPGQKEREFIIRGDEIGIRGVRVDFGGTLTGPGIPAEAPIPFNGSALTDVEVKGPPTLTVQVTHPDAVVRNVPYELSVQITNTDTIPAMYASLELDMGLDGRLVSCTLDAAGNPQCTDIEGADVRDLGHILPGETLTQTFMVIPTKTGRISSCMAAADQNLRLRVLVGTIGCIIGEFPPDRVPADGTPAVSVLPSPNATGIGTDSPVVAFFSEAIAPASIITGEGGSVNVFDSARELLPGALRLDTINERTIVAWQPDTGSLPPNTTFTVVVTTGITDLDGNRMTQEWSSTFTTTGSGDEDVTAPELTLAVLPPVNPNLVLPGQVIRVDAYAADQGSGVSRMEARIKDLGGEPGYRLLDQRVVRDGDLPPFVFALDSAKLSPGATYELLVTAYDGVGNPRDATLTLVVAATADPPTVVLPASPNAPVLRGIAVSVAPETLTGGVRRVQWFLDRPGVPAVAPFATVSLAPYGATLPTLTLPPGEYLIRALATDGLGQSGSDEYGFTLADNFNEPAVDFGGQADGAVYERGASFAVRPNVTDPAGLKSVALYVNDPAAPQPLTISGPVATIDTGALPPGAHRLVVAAINQLDVANDPANPDSWLDFTVVEPPPGEPPAAPVITRVDPPANGRALIEGTSVAGARIEVRNSATGQLVVLAAAGNGAFGGRIDAAAGDVLQVLVYDLGQSPDPSQAALATVPAAPVLAAITVDPASLAFTAAGAWADLAVTGHYDNGGSANLTTSAAFATSNPAVATVGAAGRVAAVASGTATITVTAAGAAGPRQATVPVAVDIVTLTDLRVSPSPVTLTWPGDTAQLQVLADYSDGSSRDRTAEATFASANNAVATVTGGGRVTGVAAGSTLIYVSLPGRASVPVPVTLDAGADEPPTVTLLAPADAGAAQRGDPLAVTIRASDGEGGVTAITLTASGAATFSETRQIAPPVGQTTVAFTVPIPAAAPVGGTVTLTATARDTAGNQAPAAIVSLTVVDTTAPAVTVLEPAQQTAYNFGDPVTLRVQATDAVGVTRIRYETTGAFSRAGEQVVSGNPAEAVFTFDIPYGLTDPDLRVLAYAADAAGNEAAAAPLDLRLTDADITAPATVVTATSNPGSGAVVTVSYQITDGLADLDHVRLYFRRNGIGTFNRYTGADGAGDGEYMPQAGAVGTIAFEATRMGGDGAYAFATVGVDRAGNLEPLPQSAGQVVGDPSGVATIATGAPVVLITSDTEIVGDAFDGANLRVQGATLTLVGERVFGNLELLGGAVLTHRKTTTDTAYGLTLSAWSLTIDATSRLDITGRGYLGGNQTGLGQTAHTVGFTAGARAGAGGSHGGLGGSYSNAATNPVYGDLTNPMDLGSGGGAYSGNGGDGGGRVLITAINLANDGALRANGGLSNGSASGEGAGGSVNLRIRALSGAGTISADGGTTGGANHVGGGGGRVAIRSVDHNTLNLAGLTARGGRGYYGSGADGTVYLRAEGEIGGELILNGQGANSPLTDLLLPPGQTFDDITLQNGARVIAQQPLQVEGTLRLRGNSVLTHPTAVETGLAITAARVVVEAGSAIDVTGRGYRGGNRSGYGQSGQTLGFLEGSSPGNGGSHGGHGGSYSWGAHGPGQVYGDPRRPNRLGAGGGAYNGDGGDGGGSVRIVAAEAVRVDGVIRADGGLSGGNASGEGAGGSVWIETSRLAGTGSISANGGTTNGGDHTGGGGGRVAVYADYVDPHADLGGLRSVSAWRGRGYYDNQRGAAGTVWLEIGGRGELVIDDNQPAETSWIGTVLPLMGPGVSKALQASVSGGPVDTLVTDGLIPLLPNALVGLRLNPDDSQGESFAITANTANSITVATPNDQGQAFGALAAVGKGYVGDYRYPNLAFRRGGHLQVGDRLWVQGTLSILEYGLLTHPETTTNYAASLDLRVGELVLDATGRIDVTGRGYLGGDRSGLGQTAHTLGFAAGAQVGNGGSHGGVGGHYSDAGSAVSNPLYGSFTDPRDLGSGGGAYHGAGGDGGGRILISAGSVTNDGVIRADGGLSNGSASGEGSGGSVNIVTGDFRGSGLITASGGNTDGRNHTGGGGGRIAIRYSGALTLPEANLRSLGGRGYYGHGGHGTVYLKGPGQTWGDLIIDGLGAVQPADSVLIAGGLTFDNLTLRNGVRAVADAGLTVRGTLHLTGNSTLTHSRALETGLQIDTGRLLIEADSAIDVTGRGYRGGNRTAYGQTAETLGGQPGAQYGNGGSHGGRGARYDAGSGAANPVYGDPMRPNRLGAGGGAYYGDGGDGGGSVRIVAADEVRINGAIRADGGLSGGSASGEGAGGSIWIDTPWLAGTGSISANGGSTGGGNHTGGGGGRVAIYAQGLDPAADFGGLRTISAWRGRGYYDNTQGSAGTLWLEIDGVGTLVIDDNETGGTAATGTPLPLVGPGVTTAVQASVGGEPLDTLVTDGLVPLLPNALAGLRLNPDLSQDETFRIVTNAVDVITIVTPNEHGVQFGDLADVGKGYGADYRFMNLTMRRGGHLEVGDRLTVPGTFMIAERSLVTHPPTTTRYAPLLDLIAGTLRIDATSRIDVSGRGYLGGNRAGLGQTGHTVGFAAGAQYGTGGSYGGYGGRYSSGGTTNPLYGNQTEPMDLGSGGGAYYGDGGSGGGRVFITADLLQNDGAVRADGGISAGSASGEGSGGTVNIAVGTLTGAGLITANGGTTGGGNHVGGGGGRIAIRADVLLDLPAANIQVQGGRGYYGNGEDGTVDVAP